MTDLVLDDLQARGLQVFPVSAATHEGLRELAFAMAAVVRQARADRPAAPPTRIVLRPLGSTGREDFEVVPTGEGWWVRGEKPERWVRQTDFSNDEAVGFLADRLNRLGVEERLLELGAEEGDAVLIGSPDNAVVFDFRPMVETGAELLGRRGEDARLEESRPAARRRREIEAAMDSRAEGETRADVARRLGAGDDAVRREGPDFGWADDDPGHGSPHRAKRTGSDQDEA
jgi:GTP-binding protein